MKHRFVVAVLLAALLIMCLLVTAGTASAKTTTVNTMHGSMLGLLRGSDVVYTDPVTGTEYSENYIAYGIFSSATGRDGSRLLGYGVVRLDVVTPVKGDNHHEGDFVILSEDPGTFWNEADSYWVNLTAGDREESWLWVGTWNDGVTRNKYNHQASLSLVGCNANVPYAAEAEWQSMVIDPVKAESGPFVITPINAVARVTGP